jgi:hypothetical protein
MTEDTTRKDRKEERKQDGDLTPILPAVVLPVLTDATPANASTHACTRPCAGLG